MIPKNVFVYHLDNELQKLFSLNKYNCDVLYSSFKIVTKIAFLICDSKILIPASNYFESDLSFKIINELKELKEIEAIGLISSAHNIEELLIKKTHQHGENITIPNYHYIDFLNDENTIVLPGTLQKRQRSASRDIKSSWYLKIGDSSFGNELRYMSDKTVGVSKFEDALFGVPQKLGSKAYISDYILPLLPINSEFQKNADYMINSFITQSYIASFLDEYDAACLTNIPIMDSNVVLPSNTKQKYNYISYARIVQKLKLLKYRNTNALEFVKKCTTYELIEFKFSSEWQSIINKLDYNGKENNNCSGENAYMEKYDDIKIGIITALPKECAAMKAMMQDAEECFFHGRGAGHRFFVGKIASANGKYHRVALAQCGMGNNQASIRATNMLNHFGSIDSIIMTGIAGGIPSFEKDGKQVRLGDIIVSQGITQYDFTKETPSGIECRSSTSKPSAQLLEAVDVMKTYEFDNSYPWHEYIDSISLKLPAFAKPPIESDILYDLDDNICEHIEDISRTGYPKVLIGGIASANNLLKSAAKRNELKKTFGVLAVEMEASGIADATWNHSVGYLVVRGICDYCDTHKNDLWQEYAALVSAAYTRAVIEKLPCF